MGQIPIPPWPGDDAPDEEKKKWWDYVLKEQRSIKIQGIILTILFVIIAITSICGLVIQITE